MSSPIDQKESPTWPVELKELTKSLLQKNNTFERTADGIFLPQTPADFSQIQFWCAEGKENAHIRELMRDERWRSRTDLFRDLIFCSDCIQMQPKDFCAECGLPLPAMMLTLLDLPTTSAKPWKRGA